MAVAKKKLSSYGITAVAKAKQKEKEYTEMLKEVNDMEGEYREFDMNCMDDYYV